MDPRWTHVKSVWKKIVDMTAQPSGLSIAERVIGV